MNPNEHNANNPRVFSRGNFLRLLDASLESGSYRFARQAALNWLAVFPGDLTVQLYLGRAHLAEGKLAQALPVIERVCRFDPEYLEAQQLLTAIYQKIDSNRYETARILELLLEDGFVEDQALPEWGQWHLAARRAMADENWQQAEQLLHQVLSVTPENILASIDHLAVSWQHQDRSTVYKLANLYHTHWPDCLQFSLHLAEIEIEFGNESSAVGLLHQCVANDATGHVAQRIWGLDHRYQPLWPGGLEIYLDLPVPSEVAFELGWNRLPTGELITPPQVEPDVPEISEPEVEELADTPQDTVTTPQSEPVENAQPNQPRDETVIAVEETFARLAKQMKKPSLGRSDGRYPVYVVFSTSKGLANQYGPQTRDILVKEMELLAVNVSQRPGWNTLVFLPDDEDLVKRAGTPLVESLDPWKLKLSLADLDQALAKKGQMIGALLIVGGPEIVPFHKLPNPTDDVDQDVPSDNPYATLDSNYFVPEWPVGRLPGESGKDAGLLLEQLRSLNQAHAKRAKSMPQIGDLIRWLIEFLKARASARQISGFGYTAAVWKESSTFVMRGMGDGGELWVSPPQLSQNIEDGQLLKPQLEYYNLHGLPDAVEWYGQKDGSDTSNEPDYPVALTPKNLIKNGNAPQIVYSEACYGAHILEKCEDQSLALKFLSIGSQAVIGSTTIAYGSVTSPLIGADLLGYHFWKYLRDGSTVGEAFMQAKLAVVKEMNQRQGFLDGEDQKTLISFVLYGDPLTGYEAFRTRAKTALRFKYHAEIKMVCDRQTDQSQPISISQAVLKDVKAMVEPYLPGLDEAEVQISLPHAVCDAKNHQCPTHDIGSKASQTGQPGGVVVTVSKSIQVSRRTFRQYARVTLNEKGKPIKLAVSR